MNKEQYIVYGLIDPNTKQLCYIGKSITGVSRIHDHWKPSSLKEGNTRKIQWIKHLRNNNTKYEYCIIFVVDYNLSKEKANVIIYNAEQHFIKVYKNSGFDLLNHTDGGPGAIGRQISENTRIKMSKSAKTRGLPLALIEQQKPKGNPRKIKPKTIAEGRKSRVTLGARQKYANSMKQAIRMIDCKTLKTTVILGIRDAAKIIGGKCNKTGIRLAIKSGHPYYNFLWKMAE